MYITSTVWARGLLHNASKLRLYGGEDDLVARHQLKVMHHESGR